MPVNIQGLLQRPPRLSVTTTFRSLLLLRSATPYDSRWQSRRVFPSSRWLAHSDAAQSHYRALSLDPATPQRDIKPRFLDLCLRLHPDRLPPHLSPSQRSKLLAEFHRVKAAYEVLGDPLKRASYDAMLRHAHKGPGLPPVAPPQVYRPYVEPYILYPNAPGESAHRLTSDLTMMIMLLALLLLGSLVQLARVNHTAAARKLMLDKRDEKLAALLQKCRSEARTVEEVVKSRKVKKAKKDSDIT